MVYRIFLSLITSASFKSNKQPVASDNKDCVINLQAVAKDK